MSSPVLVQGRFKDECRRPRVTPAGGPPRCSPLAALRPAIAIQPLRRGNPAGFVLPGPACERVWPLPESAHSLRYLVGKATTTVGRPGP